jgi:hypothetical protein
MWAEIQIYSTVHVKRLLGLRWKIRKLKKLNLESSPLKEQEKSPAVVIKVDEGGRVCFKQKKHGKNKYQLATIKRYRNREQNLICFFQHLTSKLKQFWKVNCAKLQLLLTYEEHDPGLKSFVILPAKLRISWYTINSTFKYSLKYRSTVLQGCGSDT